MVLEKVKAILAEQFDVEEDSITSDTSISDDLGADSLASVELVMALEEAAGVTIDDADVANLKTVGDIMDYLAAHKA